MYIYKGCIRICAQICNLQFKLLLCTVILQDVGDNCSPQLSIVRNFKSCLSSYYFSHSRHIVRQVTRCICLLHLHCEFCEYQILQTLSSLCLPEKFSHGTSMAISAFSCRTASLLSQISFVRKLSSIHCSTRGLILHNIYTDEN